MSYAEPWLEPECEPGLQQSSFALDPKMDPHRLVAQGGVAATAATAGTIPKESHWYDTVGDGAHFLFDWLVQENTAYAPTTEESANDPTKHSISEEEHVALSGLYWMAGRVGGAAAERLAPLVRGLLPKGVLQALPIEPLIAGGMTGTTGAVGDQALQDASRGEVSGWQTYADRALQGLKLGAGLGGALGVLGQATGLLRGETHAPALPPAPAEEVVPRDPTRGMTKREWKAAQSSRRRIARENQRTGVPKERPIDVTVGPEPTTPAPKSRTIAKGAHETGDTARRAHPRTLQHDQPDPSTQHGHGDHGAQVTEAQHRERLKSGETPSGRKGADGKNPKPPSSSSSFGSAAAEVEAVERARAQLMRRNPPKYTVDKKTGVQKPNRASEVVVGDPRRPYGSGWEEVEGGPPKPAGPLHKARVVFKYNPTTDHWDVLTSYPEA